MRLGNKKGEKKMTKTKHGYQYEHERITAPTQTAYIVALERKLKEYIDADRPPVYTEHDGIAAITYHAYGSYCYTFLHDKKMGIGANMVANNFDETVKRMTEHVTNYAK